MILGAGGTGKSTYVYEKITKEAAVHMDKRYFVIVPDQFTMQTQADMVAMSRPKGGIMNIDVLSFSRLAHRIFEETNAEKKQVLDDTGKNLVLRKLAGEIEEKIPYLSSNMRRDGYIHEVKSAICEFMQYGVLPQQVNELADKCAGKGTLSTKLNELNTLYGRFLDYIKDTYITSEESMDVLAGELPKSKIIRGSVVCFDGFTGFTPVQMKVLVKLMQLCEDVYITLTLEEGKEEGTGKEDLFSFTSKSYSTIMRAARDNGIPTEPNVYCADNYRFKDKPQLAHLEKNIFRYPQKPYLGETDRISIYKAANTEDEVRQLAADIRELAGSGVQYREIAVVSGSMPDYENHITRVFERFNIPVYLDKTRAMVMNPMVEFTKSILQVLEKDFDTDSVIRMMKSGLGGWSAYEADVFENFLLGTGVRGYKKYAMQWECLNKKKEPDEKLTTEVNKIRESILDMMKPFEEAGLLKNKKAPVTQYVKALYDVYIAAGVYEQLENYRSLFEKNSDFEKEKEYAQVYRLTMELLEQVYNLLGESTVTTEEFEQILESGFDEITVGTIPQSVDRVIVGDIERSRLKPVKYLFFIGVNDGFIPKKSSKCNILSDLEREYLAGQGAELSPTPQEKMYIQRFYLYSNIVKPSEKLFLSYSLMDNEGKSIRPAYLIGMMKKLFPQLKEQVRDSELGLAQVYNEDELKEFIADRLRMHAQFGLKDNEKKELFEAVDLIRRLGTKGDEALLETMIENSYFRYSDDRLDPKIAGVLYGEMLLGSISKMEQFARCAYSYFLKYGLSLRERQTYSIDNRQMGNILHGVLEEYGKELGKRGLEWFEADEKVSEGILEAALNRWAHEEGEILFDSASGRYVYKKMLRVLNKAVNALGYQLKAGSFKIAAMEVEFDYNRPLDEVNAAFDKQQRLKMNGRIDRIDTCEKDDSVYVKIIDYKTGNKDFSLVNLYYGLSLQLVVYMSEGMNKVGRLNRDKKVVPAALLYYRVADSTVDAGDNYSEEAINDLIIDSLRTKGIVNRDMDVIAALDGRLEGKSRVIPVSLNKNGEIYESRSKTMNADELKLLEDYAEYKIRNMGNEIISGSISKKPFTEGDTTACDYCEYRDVCGFDGYLEGYEYNEASFDERNREEILEQMRKDIEEE